MSLATGLEVLTGEAADLDDGQRGRVLQHDRHLEHGLQASSDALGIVGLEGLGAVAAHEHEGLTARGGSELVHQLVALARENQGRKDAQFVNGRLQLGSIGPRRLLGSDQIGPDEAIAGS